jgi:uncharacterized repeat protein (TIGR03803 family)
MSLYPMHAFVLCVLWGSLLLDAEDGARGQTFTTLHSFTTVSPVVSRVSITNSEGANPEAGLILSGETLYGTAYGGGSNANGAVFAVNVDGTGFTNLHSFTGVYGVGLTNSDGANPQGGLVLSSNTLYGTTVAGGASGNGAVFAVSTDGSVFTNLHSFTAVSGGFATNSDGESPSSGLVLLGNMLYGTAYFGGISGNGTVFGIHTDGSGFTNLHSFTALDVTGRTNGDGANPEGGLVLSGNTLYGTAYFGGVAGNGTVFALNTDGSGFTNLHGFMALDATTGTMNSDGANPQAGLVLSGNTLYGTAYDGGASGVGAVFAVNTDGSGFTNLYNFTQPSGAINEDGAYSSAGLILLSNTLYGTAQSGGTAGEGTAFALNTNGTGFATLYNFTALSGSPPYPNSDGATPYGSLVVSGNTLYGTTLNGGTSGIGTVFSLSFTPQLSITLSGQNVILSWPVGVGGFSYSGYGLWSTTNLASPAWNGVSPAPSVVGGLNTVTNAMAGKMFYRLRE